MPRRQKKVKRNFRRRQRTKPKNRRRGKPQKKKTWRKKKQVNSGSILKKINVPGFVKRLMNSDSNTKEKALKTLEKEVQNKQQGEGTLGTKEVGGLLGFLEKLIPVGKDVGMKLLSKAAEESLLAILELI